MRGHPRLSSGYRDVHSWISVSPKMDRMVALIRELTGEDILCQREKVNVDQSPNVDHMAHAPSL